MTQQFWKGLAQMLIGVIVAAFTVQPINWLVLAVTAICSVLTYFGKNLLQIWPSDSPAGAISWFNLLSGLLIALGTGILEAVGLFIVNGVVLWPVVVKVVLSVTFTYLGTTFFAPEHNISKTRGFVRGVIGTKAA